MGRAPRDAGAPLRAPPEGAPLTWPPLWGEGRCRQAAGAAGAPPTRACSSWSAWAAEVVAFVQAPARGWRKLLAGGRGCPCGARRSAVRKRRCAPAGQGHRACSRGNARETGRRLRRCRCRAAASCRGRLQCHRLGGGTVWPRCGTACGDDCAAAGKPQFRLPPAPAPRLLEEPPGEPRQLVCHCRDRMEKENLCCPPSCPLPLRAPSIGLQLLASSLRHVGSTHHAVFHQP